jgi:ubiquitin carboxyl-terminal hydrolase 8
MSSDKFAKYKNMGLTGLKNVGNSCYINSCIQCLSHTYELNDILEKKKYKLNNCPDSVLLDEWNSLRTLMWSQNCCIIPRGFIHSVQKVSALKGQISFTGHAQNDVQEFLLFIIDCLHIAMARKVDITISGSGGSEKDLIAKQCYKMIRDTYSTDYSDMIDLFYGIHVSTINTVDTNDVLSASPESFCVLSLSIPIKIPSGDSSILDCLDEFCKKDRLEGDNAWFNEKTKLKQDIDKGMQFWSLPKLLIIHLKRWDYMGRKITLKVSSPLSDLDLSSYVTGYNPDDNIYDLYGICNHHGGSYGGHYTATIKTANGSWVNFNDATVTIIDADKVLTNNAYCLFYRKK